MHSGFALVLNSWPVILAGITGFLSTHVTEILTHRNAPQWIKSGVNLVLTTLGGILITLQVVPGHTWKDYVGEIFTAFLSSMFTHWTGLTTLTQSLTASFGIGGNTPPLVPEPSGNAGGTEGSAGQGAY